MTTIAYKDGIMAADSAASDAYQFVTTKAKKIVRLANGGLYGGSGDADQRDLVDLLGAATALPKRRDLMDLEMEVEGLWVLSDGTVFQLWIEAPREEAASGRWFAGLEEINEGFFAVGSGAVHATAVMEAGGSAREAVLVACKRDLYSRGPVQTVSLVDSKGRKN